MLPVLLPLITALAPMAAKAIGNAISGKSGQEVAASVEPAVTAAVLRASGENSVEAAQDVLLRDPEKAQRFVAEMQAIALQVKIAELEAKTEEARIAQQNIQGARSLFTNLAQLGSVSTWFTPGLSLLIVVGFFGISFWLFNTSVTFDSRRETIVNVVIGALIGGFTAVINFWFGSTVGSKLKDAATNIPAPTPTPAPAPPPSPVSPPYTPPTPTPVVVVPSPPPAPPAPVVVAPQGEWHQGPYGGVRFMMRQDGYLLVEGETVPGRTVGEPVTVRRIWREYGPVIEEVCGRHGVPLEIAVACIATESRGQPAAALKEPDGRVSVGLMQVLTGTASEVMGREITAAELSDPKIGIEAGVRYIAKQYPKTKFLPPFVAAAYNAGGLHRPRDQDTNRWNLRSTGAHIDRFVLFYNDSVYVAKEDNWSRRPA